MSTFGYGSPISPRSGSNPCRSGSTSSDHFYRGERRDSATGNYQLGARTYNPARASFLTPDTYRSAPAGAELALSRDPLTANRYSYVNGDPVNYADPSGHGRCWTPRCLGKAAISVTVDVAHAAYDTGAAVVSTTVEVATDVTDAVVDGVRKGVDWVTDTAADIMSDAHSMVEDLRARVVRTAKATAEKAKNTAVAVGRGAKKVAVGAKNGAVAVGRGVKNGVSYCLGRGARTCATVAGAVALAATGVGAIASAGLMAGTAFAGMAGTFATVSTGATLASGALSLVSFKNTGNPMDLLDAALSVAGPATKGAKALRGAGAADEAKGGLHLFKWKDPTSTRATGWREGDRFLSVPWKGSAKATWAENASRLRAEMRSGAPIFETYVDDAGNLIPTKGFLNAERNLLENHGWVYKPEMRAWLPPS